MNDHYPAKLLLFGEYTVLNGSQALSVPFQKFSGKWVKHDESGQMSLIPEYFRWLQKVDIADEKKFEQLVGDFESGWSYDSDIPVGYGMGSSGAYVAALYDRYFNESEEDIEKITDKLAQMESYFHGSSSGMDPLVSFTQKAIYKDDKGEFHIIDDKGWPEGIKVYLLDSGYARETASLVNRYKERTEDHDTTIKIKRQLVPLVEHAIHFYMNGHHKKLEECISTISQFQREHFSDIIPEEIQKQWDELSAHQGVYVKLCGAGGGGYFLVISANEDFNRLQSAPNNLALI